MKVKIMAFVQPVLGIAFTFVKLSKVIFYELFIEVVCMHD